MNIGDVITFGKYQWKVLDTRDDSMLIISDQIIEQRDYHNKKEPITMGAFGNQGILEFRISQQI